MFVGTRTEGNSPLFARPLQGVKFSADVGRVSGSASVLVLADGRVVFDFDEVVVDGRWRREDGSAAPAPP